MKVKKQTRTTQYTSVVQFFLFERTSSPVLTFIKFGANGSLGTSLNQVLPKFEPFGSGFITIFQIQ